MPLLPSPLYTPALFNVLNFEPVTQGKNTRGQSH